MTQTALPVDGSGAEVEPSGTPDDTPDVAPPPRRYRGVDVFRGGVLGFLAVLVLTPTTGWRGHPAWWGWRPSDVFFPAFLLTAGAGLAFQSRERLPWPRLIRRFVTLIVLGLLFNAYLHEGTNVAQLRYPGVLQRIGVAGLLGAIVVALTRRRWIPALAISLGLALGWGMLLAHASAGCPGGEAVNTPACGTFVELDERAFGADHIYQLGTVGHDPEGIASTLGATATFLTGFSAARLLTTRSRRSHLGHVADLMAMAAMWLAVSPVLAAFAPFGKRLWTPQFVSLNAAAGLAACALLILLFDGSPRSRLGRRVVDAVAWPLEAIGRNAIVLWLTLEIVDTSLTSTTTANGDTLSQHLLEVWGPSGYFVVLFGLWLSLAAAMHLARWHIRL